MSVSVENAIARLHAPSRVEDAEPLWNFLRSRRRAGDAAAVDLSDAGPLHGAVVQLLLAFRPHAGSAPVDPFGRAWLWPLLNGAVATTKTTTGATTGTTTGADAADGP